VLRCEDIPDIKCTGGTSMTSTPDPRLAWTNRHQPRTDVVGQIVRAMAAVFASRPTPRPAALRGGFGLDVRLVQSAAAGSACSH
jgi:hypothetical protein